ncbi:MAG: 6-aminohexanoate-cyclic-dimer hydrolase [marine bacterium B5-7]|nr:MAG: 6-aminohexanoate-cyclic-dimer hydrolase [marine bacterium B5-7]
MSLGELYEQNDALGIAALVANGEVSADELLDHAHARVDEVNPSLNAVVNLQPEVARRMIRDGLPEGPFTGVPFLLKDLGAEAIEFPSHNGSRLLANTRYSQNSTLFDRLQKSGLVIFGRTTAPEGGVGPVTEAAIYDGPTRNPWDLERTPGGSSGGAGAAVAGGIVPAAHGSDGGGSVRIPASNCGLFGMKPTRARLPDGPFAGEGWAGMAIDGFLTRSVRDTAALLDAVQGPDLGAPYRAPPLVASFMEALGSTPVGLRVAIMDGSPTGEKIHPDCHRAVIEAAHLLAELGHHVEEAAPQADYSGMMRAWTVIVACGTALWVRSRVASRKRPLAEGDIEPVAMAACEYAKRLDGADYLQAVEKIHSFGRELAAFFVNHDALLSATMAEPPAKIGRFKHDRTDFEAYRLGPDGVFPYSPFTAAFNASGQPAASLPLFFSDKGLPIGVHLAMDSGQDETLISLSAQLEAARPWFDKRPARPG